MKEVYLSTPLGRYINENVNEKMKTEFFQRYLQDFVSMTFKVSSEEEFQVRDDTKLNDCIFALK